MKDFWDKDVKKFIEKDVKVFLDKEVKFVKDKYNKARVSAERGIKSMKVNGKRSLEDIKRSCRTFKEKTLNNQYFNGKLYGGGKSGHPQKKAPQNPPRKYPQAPRTQSRPQARPVQNRYPQDEYAPEYVRAKKSASRKQLKKWQKALLITLGVLVLIFGSVLGAAYHFLGRVNTEKREVQANVDQLPEIVTEAEEIPEGFEVVEDYEVINADGIPIMSSKDVTNVLLIGTDKFTKNTSRARSDTMVILSIDNKHKKLKMTSLLRDLYVTIPGRTKDDRLNHSHAYGGPDLLIRTIEYNFRVKIDKYMRVDFDQFEGIINKLGGVNIRLTAAEARIVKKVAAEGIYHLNGEETRTFTRIRNLDSDFGRTNRQRKVISAVINDLKKKDIGTLTSFMNDVLPLVATDYNSTELLNLIMQSPTLSKYDIYTNRFPKDNAYQGVYIRGMAVLVTDLSVAATELQEFIYE